MKYSIKYSDLFFTECSISYHVGLTTKNYSTQIIQCQANDSELNHRSLAVQSTRRQRMLKFARVWGIAFSIMWLV